MNPLTDNAPQRGTADAGRDVPRPAHWCEALMALIASRIELIQFEAQSAVTQRMCRMLGILVAAICLFFTWALVLAGGIAAIASVSGWSWYGLAFIAAALHLFIAASLIMAGRSKQSSPAFPLTRAEFQKDREWIENLQKKPRSNV